jgi:hypothetical protein
MAWARSQNMIDARIAVLTVAGLAIASVNLLSWHGTFWAIWPLLALAIAAGVRWVSRS